MKVKLATLKVDYGKNKSRLPFTVESCQSLAESMAANGQDTPIKVVTLPEGGEFTHEVRIGYRRVTAGKHILHWEEMDATSLDGKTEEEITLENIRENWERESTTYFEQCVTMRDLFPSGTSINAIATTFKRSTTWVRCRWLIWTLTPEVILGVETGDLTPSDISMMIGKSADQQIVLVQRLRDARLSGESKETVASTIKKKRNVRIKRDIHKMANVLLSQGRDAEKIALLWAAGDIDDSELLDYNGIK